MKKNFPVILLLLLLVLGSVQPSLAQSSVVAQISIKDISTSIEMFPNVIIKGVITDTEGMLVSGITKENLSITENGEAVDFEFSEVPLGARTVMILDLGKWINNPAIQSRELVKEKIQNVAIRYIDTMKENDLLQIVVTYGFEPFVVQAYTSDKTQLRDTIQRLNWSNDEESYGLEAISRAIPEIVDAPNDLFKRVIFISGGIMTRDIFGDDTDELTQKLNTQSIPLYSVHIPWNRGSDYYSQFKLISEETDGLFINYITEKDLESFFSSLNSSRNIFEFTFRSKNGTSTSRTVTLSSLGTSGASDTKEYDVDPAWISPASIEILVNNGESIIIPGESLSFTVPVNISINGLGNRIIETMVFQVNGQEVSTLTQTGEGSYTTTWSLPANDLPTGNTEVFLELIAEDELGITHRGSSANTISRSPSVNPLCNWLGGLPGIGNGLESACINSGFTLAGLINIILLIAVLTLGIILWQNKGKVAEVGRDIGVRVTNAVERLTNRLRKLEPKARLTAIQGIPDGQRKEFDLYGETPIGRSNGSAELIFDNDNVSRLHCVIHESHTGSWTIEDKESVNGTFVNGQKLSPFTEKEIKTDDFIELGPVEYGGIKFRFEIIETFTEEEKQYNPIPEEDGEKDQNEQPKTRVTKRLKNSEDGVEIDPSDPANQKW